MKQLFLILSTAVVFFNCTPKPTYYQQSSPDYSEKYASQMEPGSKLIQAWYHYTIEQLPTGEIVKKDFYPDTKQLTHLTTYTDKDLKTKHGPEKILWDDGSLVSEGNYFHGQRDGEWITFSGKWKSVGLYKSGEKSGAWVTSDSLGIIRSEFNYLNGKKHGSFKKWNSDGKLIHEGEYEMEELDWERNYEEEINNSDGEVFSVVEQMPHFIGAPCKSMSGDEKRQCDEMEMLKFIYSNIKYPAMCREYGIEGMAIIEFVVEKDGSILEVWSKRGICDAIKNECIRVVKMMPTWSPGIQRDNPVRVHFSLPVRFRLE